MKITSVFAAAAIVLLAGCGHDHAAPAMSSMPPPSSPPPPSSMNVSVTTSQLLTNYAQQSAETTAPFAVNGGAFTINDSSDTSEPIAVSAN